MKEWGAFLKVLSGDALEYWKHLWKYALEIEKDALKEQVGQGFKFCCKETSSESFS